MAQNQLSETSASILTTSHLCHRHQWPPTRNFPLLVFFRISFREKAVSGKGEIRHWSRHRVCGQHNTTAARKGFFSAWQIWKSPFSFFRRRPRWNSNTASNFAQKRNTFLQNHPPMHFLSLFFGHWLEEGSRRGPTPQKSLFSSLFPFLGKGIFNYNPRRKERNCGDHRSSHHNLYFQT